MAVRYWKIDPEKRVLTEVTGAPDLGVSTWIADQICLDLNRLYQNPTQGGLLYYGPELRDPRGFYMGNTRFFGLSMFAGPEEPFVRWTRRVQTKFKLLDEDMPFVEQMSESWRKILLLYENDNMPYEIIAKDTFHPLGTIKSRIHRMRQAIIANREGVSHRPNGMFS